MATLTKNERFKILQDAQAAEARGDFAEASRLARTLPLPIHLAEFMKKEFGPQYLIEGGWNLSEIEDKHGKDWVVR